MRFTRIKYSELDGKQQEIYNFQQASAILADYGFAIIKLDYDWQGADFIAQHKNGETFLKVQLKSRLTFAKKYENKSIQICFPDPSDPDEGQRDWYLFDHDKLLINKYFLEKIKKTYDKVRYWSSPGLTSKDQEILSSYRL